MIAIAMPPTPPAAVSKWLARTDTQAKLTLAQMQRYVRGALNNHDWVWFARSVIASSGAEGHDAGAVANSIRAYVARRIHYLPDPVGIENITPPLEHMAQLQAAERSGPYGYIMGDCDDAATLSAAIAGVAGIPATFTIRAFDWGRGPSPYQHVFATLFPRRGPPVVCDTTKDAQQLPPTVQRDFTITV